MTKTLIIALLMPALVGIMAPDAWSAAKDITKHSSCKLCGMDREKFSHSRTLIEYEDGSTTGLCSIHCAAVEMAVSLDKTLKALLVADRGSSVLIDAEKAYWVMGGSQKGVMTKNPKWAFEKREAAEAFIKTNGGTTALFEDMIKAVYNDMYEDTQMIREKRKMMKQHSGNMH